MLHLAEIFQSGMILQRRKPVKIWGSSDESCTVIATLNGEKMGEFDIQKGEFSFHLPPQEAKENACLVFSVEQTGEMLSLTDVDFGEIWVAGGQSNMEFFLKYDKEGAQEIAAADDPHLRYYNVGRYAWDGERKLGLKNGEKWDRWLTFLPENASEFSAAAVYFAKRMRRELGVPVGIVGCNWGGTSASCWVSRESLEKDPGLKCYVDAFEKDIQGVNMEKYLESLKKPNPYANNPKVIAETEKRMKNEIVKSPGLLTRIVGKIIVATSKMTLYSEYRPGGLYETMVKKIAGFTAAGFLWYQGESDQDHADVYDRLLKLLIDTWRTDCGEELPFLLAQLTSYEGWPECSGRHYEVVRAQQQKVADTVSGVYMASIMDVGSRYDIHPKEKRPVGERLAALALRHTYGLDIPCEAPRMTAVTRQKDGLTVHFAHAGGGLAAKGDISHLFRVTAGGKTVPVAAKVQGSTVILSGNIPEGAQVAFAYESYCPMTLFSRDGLAARPCEPITIQED